MVMVVSGGISWGRAGDRVGVGWDLDRVELPSITGNTSFLNNKVSSQDLCTDVES
jgi:hypothetical protein